ncbi:KilA-N domain-containing protein [Colletotrichum kahawae]|uniref:KilA-N domain-containing protein n=1 Tax=Colletotrichum kahawae TaxID=34407 RepID=A0AAD9YA16_COLKA|nr:KilA-N domain-containing protein [Colletotrichum kahawae]
MRALEKYIPKDHKTLHDALKRVQYLRTRITNLTGDSSDHLWAILLLNYFKTRLPDTYKHYTNNNKKPCWTAYPELIPLIYKNRTSLLERANKHKYNKDYQGDGVSTAPNTSVFVKGSSGILSGSALVSIAMRDRHVASPPIYATIDSRVIYRNDIIVDSRCSGYLFRDMEHFIKYTPRDDLLPFTAANRDDVRPLGVSTVFFQTYDPLDLSKTIDWTINDVEYSLLSPANLLSPGKLRKAGIDYDYKLGSLVYTNNARPIGKVEWIMDVMVLQTCITSDVPVNTAIALASVCCNLKLTLEMIYRCLIYAYPSRVIEACRCVGIVFSKEEMENFHCEACHLAKSTEIVSCNSPLPLTQISEEIYLNLIEVKPLLMTSKRYALHFLDKYSGYHWLVLLLNHYYEVMRDAIKNFHDVFNNITSLNVKT